MCVKVANVWLRPQIAVWHGKMLQNAAAVTQTHTCNLKHPIRSEPERCGSRRSVPWMRMFSFEWVGSRGGMEGVIKLKRLGEDELLRIYESRHWLRNPNPGHSASTHTLVGRTRRICWTGANPGLDWNEPEQLVICMHCRFRWQGVSDFFSNTAFSGSKQTNKQTK